MYSTLELDANTVLGRDRDLEVDGWVGLAPFRPGAATALAKIAEGLAELAAADPDDLTDDELASALDAVVEAGNRLAGQEARLIDRFDRREVHRRDACVTATSWLRWRTGLGYGDARRRVKRARLLRDMPLLHAALADGGTTPTHVDMVAHRAIPMRREAIAEHDATLAQLARDGEPGHMRSAVSEIVLHLSNDDGGEPEPACSREDLRELRLRQGYDGLGVLDATTTPVLSELLHRVRDLYSQPDPQDTPSNRRRTPAQRFHDALQDALTVAIDQHPGAAIGGVKTHIVLFCDLYTALGEDELARIAPRLGSTGRIDPDTARHLITTTNTTLRAVLGLGPWRPISVGRAMRNLPPWLRTAAQLAHVHCRGVGCDRPFAWTEADHNIEWTAGGETGLDNNAPLCEGHHSLRHADGWTVMFDSDTGVVTWIPPDESRRIALPPPDP